MGNKSLDITPTTSGNIGIPTSKKRMKKGMVRPFPGMNGRCSNTRKNSPDKIVIRGFPTPVWQSTVGGSFVDEGLLTSDRVVALLKKLGLGERWLIMENPFSESRLRLWILKKSSMRALNFLVNFTPEVIKNVCELSPAPENYYAKIKEGVYFLQIIEEYLGSGRGRFYIIFDPTKGFDGPASMEKFMVSFSKELYLLSKKENKTIGDPTAFDDLFLPDEVIKDFRADFEDFLHSRKMYIEDLKLPWKRGYMLIGSPGNGKTKLIRSVCNYYGLEYFDIKKVIDNGGNLNMETAISSSIDYLLYPDEERPKVCILEDIDKFTAFQSGAEQDYGAISLHSLLRGLDGVDAYSDIILMATSNFPDVIHEAIAGRPGRFDKIYSIEKPTEENIKKLLTHYRLTFDGCDAEFVSKKLLGSSMAFVAEFVKMAKMKYKRNNITVEEANKLLDGIKAHQKLCETHFKEERKIGFR